MRSEQEVSSVLALIERGLNDCAISRATGIPRGTVRDWRHGRLPKPVQVGGRCFVCGDREPIIPSRAYAYLLGQYLGDGFIARQRRGVFALRISSFSGYPGIIAECVEAVQAVMPHNKVSVIPVRGARLVIIASWSKHWPCLLPQHGPGKKHERRIRFTGWQQAIVEDHPEAFLRGLVHSDGCRYVNRVKHHEYASYGFTNMSSDIMKAFTDGCDQLGIKWRRSNFKNIAITQRGSVAVLDTFIGPKA